MKEIVFKDNFAFIYLNTSFYSKESIEKAYNNYKDFFKLSITKLGNYLTLKLEPTTNEYEIKTLANEFLNFIISEMQGGQKQ